MHIKTTTSHINCFYLTAPIVLSIVSVLFDRGYVLYIVSVFVAILIRGLESRGQVIGSRYIVGGSP